MPQFAERAHSSERRRAPIANRSSLGEPQRSRAMARPQGRADSSSGIRLPVSEIVGGLPARLRTGVEALSGIAMDDVRVHRNSSEPAKLGALAFTRGAEIHLGPDQEQHLPHEAWHVVQQREGRVQATTQMKGAALNDDAGLEREADRMGSMVTGTPLRMPASPHAMPPQSGPAVVQRQPAPGPINERVLNRTNTGERSRTVVRIEVVGHASPRWKTANTPQKADELNWRLAEDRAKQVRFEVEKLLRNQLPNRTLVFEYRYRPSTEKPSDTPVRALDEPSDISLDFQGRGSTETLTEAGRRGRTANDDPMRRVDVRVNLHSQTETDVEEDVEHSQRKLGASTKWSIWVSGEAGIEAVGKAGGILIQIRNEKTGQIGTYAGWTSGLGASVGISIAKTSPADFESFTTPEPMTFADFSAANFSITSFGAGIGVFGAEWSKFRFDKFLGHQKTPGGIQVGGLSFGGIELNLGSAVYGVMFLIDNPSEYYTETTRLKRTQTYESLGSEGSSHRVFFGTGVSEVNAWESDRLNEYLFGVVTRSGL